MPFGPPTPLAQQDLVDLLRRNLDESWIGGLLDDPSSLSMFVGMIASALRVQAAGDADLDLGGYVLTAPGPAPANSTVLLTRPSGAAVTVSTAVRFLDGRGMVWRPTADFLVASSVGAQTVSVPISTERRGHFLNTFEPLAYVAVDALPGGFAVAGGNTDPAVGGSSDILGLHGSERGAPRAPAETDDAYRHRMLLLLDKVSPAALAEAVLTVLDASSVGLPIARQIVQDGLRALREPFADSAQPAQRNLMGLPPAFFDDAYADDLHGPVVRDTLDATLALEVSIPTPIDTSDGRLFYDDGFVDDALLGFTDQRGPTAVPDLLAALADELDRRRMGGVRVSIYLGLDQHLDRHVPAGGLEQAGDWTAAGLAAPPDLVTALQTFSGDDAYAVSTQGRGAGPGTTAGDLWFRFPALTRAPTSIRFLRLVAWVKEGTTSVGTPPQIAFVFQPAGGAIARLVGLGAYPVAVAHQDWRSYELILEQNPATAAPWALADLAGIVRAGVANAAAAGVTDELRVAELRLDVVASFG